jgi:DNA processing protein
VLAVPGEITSALSAGSNALLRLGATPLLTVDDVLWAFGLERRAPEAAPVEGTGAAVLAALAEQPAGADELARRTGLATGELAALLTRLELDGRVTVEEGVYRMSV